MRTKQVLLDPKLEKHLRGHGSGVTGLSFGPNSKLLVSSGRDKSLILWNLKDKTRAHKFLGHSDVVSDVVFSPAGNLIASSSYDRTIRLWVPTIGGGCSEFRAHTQAIQSVDFSYDGLTLATASNDKSVWSVSPSKVYLFTLRGHRNWVRSARFSHDGKTIVTTSDDKTIKVFDKRVKKCIHTFSDDNVPQKAVLHPQDKYIAAGFKNGKVKIYDARMLKQLQLHCCHEDDVTNIVYHPNGNYLFSTSLDGTAKVLDLLEGRCLYTLEGNIGSLTAVSASADGHQFALGGINGSVLLWRTDFDNVFYEDVEDKSDIKIRDSDCLYHTVKQTSAREVYSDHEEVFDDDRKQNSIGKANSCDLERLVGEQKPEEDFKKLSTKMDILLKMMNRISQQLSAQEDRIAKLESKRSSLK